MNVGLTLFFKQLLIRTQNPAPNLGGYPGSHDGTVLEIAQKAGASAGQNLAAPRIFPPMYSVEVDVMSSDGPDDYKQKFEQAWLQGKDSEDEDLPPASVQIWDKDESD
ncbi:hypothetical protein BDV40DRAFT_294707 [Aspergillus tamarii]|uniref:Uncharacterized protein n=1 Tax=Aspergillus tamarii TaxID=41984 RepID=A0A5N6VAX0_ASPTM|nr:hypothetical protein BDV40DRAFT_294707 [Aspergillus tamarii]